MALIKVLQQAVQQAVQQQQDNINKIQFVAEQWLKDNHPKLFEMIEGIKPEIFADTEACFLSPQGKITWHISVDNIRLGWISIFVPAFKIYCFSGNLCINDPSCFVQTVALEAYRKKLIK